ncbi:tRNA pseudouridine(55) synthase TruB [Desulfoplanes sp.]
MAVKPPQQHGVLVLDKPEGPTSAACLNVLKHTLGQKKIGHAGTLDPMATGVLLVLLGQGTKLAPYLTSGSKTYAGELKLGVATDTYDIQGQVIEERPTDQIPPEKVEREVLLWQSLTEQDVPPVSAAKHRGKPLYKLHREGKQVPVKTKSIHISQVEIISMDLPLVQFRVTCSQGTYIRSLAHSLGKRLGCGATLTGLRRERCHPFGLDQAHLLDEVADDAPGFSGRVIPLDAALPHWPSMAVSHEQAERVKNGAWLPIPPQEAPGEGEKRMLTDPKGNPLALVQANMREDSLYWVILRGLWSS